MIDGLGFEEVNQAVTSTAIVSGTNVYGTTSVQSALGAFTTTSGGNLRATTINAVTSISGAAINNADGLLKSASIGSPAVYNGIVQAGTLTTAAGSEVDVEFGVPFSSKTYAITFGTSGAAASATLPTLSGAATSSGATVIGDASTTYYYIAAGY